MSKPGRNDPCTCGSGKKYKNCCMQKEHVSSTPKPLSQRKFTARVISSGTNVAHTPAEQQDIKAAVNYSTLMDRSFGQAIHTKEEKPPLPTSPTEFLVDKKTIPNAP